MKNKIQILLSIITLSLFSCDNVDKSQVIPISNINTDFPNPEKLEFKPFNKYDIMENDVICLIDDSILWNFDISGRYNLGYCYDLNTGEKLSTIATIGRAAYEFTVFPDYLRFVGDSIQCSIGRGGQYIIRTFSKKDIIDKKSMSERNFSEIVSPDSVCIGNGMIKLPNGSVLATLKSPMGLRYNYGINERSVVVFNNNEANSYETINYDSFDIKNGKDSEVEINRKIKSLYNSGGRIDIKGNNMAVFPMRNQFMLYTFDTNSGNVVKEKRYTKLQVQVNKKGGTHSVYAEIFNDMKLSIQKMQSNDKYILCTVDGYFSEEDKELKVLRTAIFVFDWDLNPKKRFDLPNNERGYIISEDCSAVYFRENTDEGITLSKADLNI